MSARVINVFLGTVMVASIAMSFAATRDFSRPNWEVLPDMVHSPTYQAFEPNPNDARGMTLRQPAADSIPRGLMPLHYEKTPEDALRAGEELVNPYVNNDEEVMSRGMTAFAIFCQPCHGASGAGDGMVARRGYPPPPSLLLEHAINMKDGQLFHVMSFGQGNMPSHASQVSREDRWRIVNYIRSLQAEALAKSAGANNP